MQYKADRSTLEGSTIPKYRKSKNSVIFRDPKHIRVLQKKNLKFLSRKKKVVEKNYFFSIRILIRKRFLIVPRNTFFLTFPFFLFFFRKSKKFRKDMTIHSEMRFKKIPSKNIFSSWRKMILKILIFKKIENFDFFNRKIDFLK